MDTNHTRMSYNLLSGSNKFEVIREYFDQYNNALGYMPNKRVVLALYCLIFFMGSFLNILLIFTITHVRNPKSKSNRWMLLMHVSCDLALVWFGVPYTTYVVVYKSWKLGSAMCQLSSFLIYFIVALTNFLLVSICLNRCIAIARAGRRAGGTDYDVNCRVWILLFLAFSLATLIALPSAIVSEVRQAVLSDPRFQPFASKVCRLAFSSATSMLSVFIA